MRCGDSYFSEFKINRQADEIKISYILPINILTMQMHTLKRVPMIMMIGMILGACNRIEVTL